MIDKLFVRIIFILIACLIFSNLSFAGLLADKTLLDSTLRADKWQIDGQVSYSLATETLTGTPGNMKWISISDAGIDYFTYLNIPIKISYGLAENFSVRLVLPFASFNGKSKTGPKSSASGLGNVEIEGLYSFLNESVNRPALSALLNIKGGTGKKLADLAADEGYVGSRSTDITLGLVAMKSMAAFKTKLFLGYLMTTPYKEKTSSTSPDMDVNLTDQMLYALGGYLPLTTEWTLGGELWGAVSLGKEQWSLGGVTADINNSNRDYLMLTPSIYYTISDKMQIRGSADFVLSKSMATTVSIWDLLKFTTYSVGASFNL